ncbi:MAG: RNA methyltransferase [Paludibacterium sp.]|uniref:TrmH family RNA methyltransferase n=1 Tax=Paludibacterium sp. TaxID=1917523 RepID=UPI0025EFDA67|nr:RNA methyltransferase [Paludibacterium sp.]MBV8047475.1 RNA methyltransferase [Paludibacterium sp.]MBV8646727.1 RNA methyltransferase [Paludibacterium sp.]
MPQSIKQISSPHNDTLKQLIRLIEQGRERRKQGLLVVEGIHLAQSAMEAGLGCTQLFVNRLAREKTEVVALMAATSKTASVYELDENLLARVSALASAPEVLAVCLRPRPAPAPATAARVLLEDIQDPGNMGTILRSAAASGVTEVYLSAGCVDVYAPKVLRAGMGAHFHLALHEQADLPSVLADFAGVRLVTSLAGDRSLYQQDLTGPVAFVFGNEGAGVSAALHDAADARVRIPMPGHAESLNVAMAATLCLFERVRQLESAGSERQTAAGNR